MILSRDSMPIEILKRVLQYAAIPKMRHTLIHIEPVPRTA
jgi:hypothetical protein